MNEYTIMRFSALFLSIVNCYKVEIDSNSQFASKVIILYV